MKKTININNHGILTIKGDYQDTALYLNKTPIQYSWFAEIGSTWRYHVAKGITEKDFLENKDIDDLLKNGINTEDDFNKVLAYYKNILDKGQYEFGLYNFNIDCSVIKLDNDNFYKQNDYYGGLFDITFTQTKLNNKIIDFYYKAIKNGIHPTVILLHNNKSQMIFVIDGHHKYLAYKKIGISPQVILISKTNDEYISFEKGKSILESMNCKDEKYISILEDEKKYKHYAHDFFSEKEIEEVYI